MTSIHVHYRGRMTNRPRASLRRILEDLGSTVLDVAASPGELDAEVTGVHIYDPLDELLLPAGGSASPASDCACSPSSAADPAPAARGGFGEGFRW
jgi:hypothetical protein